MTRILGIDPGSRITGYGVVDCGANINQYVISGCIRTNMPELSSRLKVIFEGVLAIVKEYRPDEFAIENVFMAKNANSALKLGQARGAAICAGVHLDLPVAEYTAKQVKLAVVGYGAAEKSQVQHMIKKILGIQGALQEDAADALAVSMCHAHARKSQQLLNNLSYRKGSHA